MKYKLIKKGARTGHTGTKVNYVEWTEDGRYKALHDDIRIGCSLILDVDGAAYQWLTTPIVTIDNTTAKSIRFTTQNSEYKLTWK